MLEDDGCLRPSAAMVPSLSGGCTCRTYIGCIEDLPYERVCDVAELEEVARVGDAFAIELVLVDQFTRRCLDKLLNVPVKMGGTVGAFFAVREERDGLDSLW